VGGGAFKERYQEVSLRAWEGSDNKTAGGYDFVLLHVKAVDDTGHDRMLSMKVGCVGGQCGTVESNVPLQSLGGGGIPEGGERFVFISGSSSSSGP
jgi:hypothetical protein